MVWFQLKKVLFEAVQGLFLSPEDSLPEALFIWSWRAAGHPRPRVGVERGCSGGGGASGANFSTYKQGPRISLELVTLVTDIFFSSA